SWQTQNYSGSFNPISYDASNRLVGVSSTTLQESGITYDKNGNIKTLTRSGSVVDNLTYSYTDSGNQLKSINDTSGNSSGVKSGVSNYSYDNNGNMLSDGNKNATIKYNLLNLPNKVTMGGSNNIVQYVYDAAGTKLKTTAPGTSTSYA